MRVAELDGLLPDREKEFTVRINTPSGPCQFKRDYQLRSPSSDDFCNLGIDVQVDESATVAAPMQTSQASAPGLVVQTQQHHGLEVQYVDVNLPDGTQVYANTACTKSWLLYNPGPDWNDGVAIVNLRTGQRSKVKPLKRDQEVTVSVTFNAPAKPGLLNEYYRLVCNDEPIGPKMRVQLDVILYE